MTEREIEREREYLKRERRPPEQIIYVFPCLIYFHHSLSLSSGVQLYMYGVVPPFLYASATAEPPPSLFLALFFLLLISSLFSPYIYLYIFFFFIILAVLV